MADRTRDVVVSIDDLLAMLKDYVGGEDVPADAQPVRLMLNPQERKLAIVAESAAWGPGMAPLQVRFDLRRVHAVGGGN